MYARNSLSRRRRTLGDDSIFSLIGKAALAPIEQLIAPGVQYLTLPSPAPPPLPTPGPPAVAQGNTGIFATIKDTIENALPTWAGGTGGALTTNQIANTISSCQQDVLNASRNLSQDQINAGMARCAPAITAVAALPPAQLAPQQTALGTWLIVGSVGLVLALVALR